MLLHFVGEDTLDWVDFKSFANFGNDRGDILIESTNCDGPGGGLESVVGSEDNVGLLSLGLSSDNDGVSSVTSISIDVSSDFNLDEITSLKSN
jgi:hypothetical protein